MSKVFQIFGGFVYTQITGYKTAEEASRNFAPDIQIVDAPDNVFEGWGYDETKTGDARFIKPVPPEGWSYDDETGTFYPIGEKPPSYVSSAQKREHAYETEPCVEFNSEILTVDEANKMFYQYLAEGNTLITAELTQKISTAKNEIRQRFPEDNEQTED